MRCVMRHVWTPKFQLSGPTAHSYTVVQFMWTKRRIKHCQLSAMLTTKIAGGSYLNKVELQNGRLALGHSNIYTTPTTYGTNFTNRKLEEAKLHQNIKVSIRVYTSQINGVSCGSKPIHLTRGSNDELSKRQLEMLGNYCFY